MQWIVLPRYLFYSVFLIKRNFGRNKLIRFQLPKWNFTAVTQFGNNLVGFLSVKRLIMVH